MARFRRVATDAYYSRFLTQLNMMDPGVFIELLNYKKKIASKIGPVTEKQSSLSAIGKRTRRTSLRAKENRFLSQGPVERKDFETQYGISLPRLQLRETDRFGHRTNILTKPIF